MVHQDVFSKAVDELSHHLHTNQGSQHLWCYRVVCTPVKSDAVAVHAHADYWRFTHPDYWWRMIRRVDSDDLRKFQCCCSCCSINPAGCRSSQTRTQGHPSIAAAVAYIPDLHVRLARLDCFRILQHQLEYSQPCPAGLTTERNINGSSDLNLRLALAKQIFCQFLQQYPYEMHYIFLNQRISGFLQEGSWTPYWGHQWRPITWLQYVPPSWAVETVKTSKLSHFIC